MVESFFVCKIVTWLLWHTSNRMGTNMQWNVWHPDNVKHRWLLPANQICRQRSTTSTHCRRGWCRLANVIRHIEAYKTIKTLSQLAISHMGCTFAKKHFRPFSIVIIIATTQKLISQSNVAGVDTTAISNSQTTCFRLRCQFVSNSRKSSYRTQSR